MAADYGTTRTQTIEDFGLADDAAIARRTLRVTRKTRLRQGPDSDRCGTQRGQNRDRGRTIRPIGSPVYSILFKK